MFEFLYKIFINILQHIYNSYYSIKGFIKRFYAIIGYFLLSISLITILFYVYFQNPLNIKVYLLPVVILLILFSVSLTLLSFQSNNEGANLKLLFKRFRNLGYITLSILLIVFFVNFVYYISQSIIVYTARTSITLSLILTVLVMGIIYNTLFKSQTNNIVNDRFAVGKLLIDVLFYIPCLVIDAIDFLKKDYAQTTSSTWILAGLSFLIILSFYVIPYLQDFLKADNGIKLLDKQKELNQEVIFISQSDLREKIIKNRPLYQRQILNAKQKIENDIQLKGGLFDENKKLFDFSTSYELKKYASDVNEIQKVEDHAECSGVDIKCDETTKNIKCDSTNITDYYNMYIKCDEKLDTKNAFLRHIDTVYTYADINKDKQLSLQQYCKQDIDLSNSNVSASCKVYNDISNNVFTSSKDPAYNDKTLYFCEDNNISEDPSLDQNKYKPIIGYNDLNDTQTILECSMSEVSTDGVVTESFGNYIHIHDELNNVNSLLNGFSKDEQIIIKNALNDSESNVKEMYEQAKSDPDALKLYLINYFSSNKNYNTLLSKINEYNNDTNKILNQEISSLITMINRKMDLHEYNYHYGISFWLYLDPSLLKSVNKNNNKRGLIMNYANQPEIYYNFDTSEIIISVYDEDSSSSGKGKQKVIYRSNNILFQKWNNFIVNFNYGTLDIFINNNLVASANDLVPYSSPNNNTIRFGSSDEKMNMCGICSVVYYEEPLSLSKVKEIYSKQNNPCQS